MASKEYNRQYYLENQDKFKEYRVKYNTPERNKAFNDKSKGRREKWSENNRFKIWKIKAKNRGLEFLITEEYLDTLPKVCAFTGVELTNERNKPNTISLDRIDSTKGYIEGNVQFTCPYINLAKRTSTDKDFINMCKAVVAYREKEELWDWSI